MLEEKIREILDVEAPMRTIQSRTRYNRWISSETAMLERDSLREVARRTQEEEDWRKFRISRNVCTSRQRKNKQTFLQDSYRKLEDEKDTGRLFAMTRRLLGWSRSGPPTTFTIDGQIIRKQKDIVNVQSKYYQDKVRNIKESIPGVNIDPLIQIKRAFSRWRPQAPIPEFQLELTTISEVRKLIENLKSSQAFGHDEIDAVTLKSAAPCLAIPMTHVINLLLGQKKFLLSGNFQGLFRS